MCFTHFLNLTMHHVHCILQWHPVPSPICQNGSSSPQLRSGTPHWTRRIGVGVQHATLNSQDRSWGPACHTELTESRRIQQCTRSTAPCNGTLVPGPICQNGSSSPRLRSGTPHWTRRIGVGVQHATLNSRDRSWGWACHTELTESRRIQQCTTCTAPCDGTLVPGPICQSSVSPSRLGSSTPHWTM